MEYIIQDHLCTAKINSLGAELISFHTKNKIEFLWQADEKYWSQTAPNLFPYVGPAPAAGITIYGETYPMPRHGLIRSCLFQPDTMEESSISFCFDSDDLTAAAYPFSFRYTITYTLINGSLHCLHRVFNTGSRVMPFLIGFHPALNCPILNGTVFEDYHLLFNHHEKIGFAGAVSSVLPLTYEFFQHDAVLIAPICSDCVSLLDPAENIGIRFEFHGFHSLALWTPPGKQAPFLSLEPWNAFAYSDFSKGWELTDKTYVQYAKPKEIREYTMSFTPLGF